MPFSEYVIKLHANNKHTKFQSNIFIFDSAVKKRGEGDDLTFETQFWASPIIARKKKLYLWNPETKLGGDTMDNFVRKF